MGTIWVQEFTGGLDSRRLPETTKGGVLLLAQNGHITRGGEFEQRAAFVPTFALPDGTTGLTSTPAGLVTFGSGPPPVMPAGVTYQCLQHADGNTPLLRVLSVDLYAGKLYVSALFGDGIRFHFYDGVRVADWFDGRARVHFEVTAAPLGPPAAALTDLRINDVAIITPPISATSTLQQMASDIAAAINAKTSSPDYTAVAVGTIVYVSAVESAASYNGFYVAFTAANGLTLSFADGRTMSGGVDQGSSYTPGTFVKTIGSKVYSVSGPDCHFSGIKDPTHWNTDATGAGFIDMSTEASGSEQLVALAKYNKYVTVFAGKVTQIWYMDPDPTQNSQVQVLNNTGTFSPNSVTQFGDNDLFYLDESGCRSLRARDASNAASTTDVGVPIDTLITDKLRGLPLDQRYKIFGIIEPAENRFWLSIVDTIYVFSFFAGASVSAWSTYVPSYQAADGTQVPFVVEGIAIFQQRVYVRAGKEIYAYGGADGQAHDNAQAVAWLPYLDANDPTRFKRFNGLDAALTGLWDVAIAMEPTRLDVEEPVATLGATTYNAPTVPAAGEATHFGPRFRSRGQGPHRLGAVVVHYTSDAEEDE